jgi:hypothetical protein
LGEHGDPETEAMMPRLKAGVRLRSAVCSTEVMVIRAPADDVDVRCGGAPLIDLATSGEPGAAPAANAAGGSQLGKRYVNAADDLELLCTKPGAGSLALGDAALAIKGAKPLPSSD